MKSKFLFNGVMYEMAAPLDEHRSFVLYHGTDEEHAKDILATGHLKGRIVQGRAEQAPVAGYVYTSKDVMYAAGYAGAYSEWGSGSRSERINGTAHFTAYIFVVDSSKITDVLVDEDVLGEVGTSKYIEGKYPADVVRYLQMIANDVATPTQLRRATSGEMAPQSAIGKKMHKAIPEAKMQWLIGQLPHIAVKGEQEVPIKGYYTLHKSVSTAEEFFDSAEYHPYPS